MIAIPDWLRCEVDDYFPAQLPVKPATILDIGANIGAFALRAHQEWPAAQIICFEPMPFNVELLKQNVSPAWCQIVPSAVRAHSGEDDIYLGDMFVTGGFVKGFRQTDRKIRVNCVGAGELPPCELIKIDTEGSEIEILQFLDLGSAQAILLEHHSQADAATIKQMLEPVFDILKDESNQDIGTMIFVRKA